jgi:hypothetical protein
MDTSSIVPQGSKRDRVGTIRFRPPNAYAYKTPKFLAVQGYTEYETKYALDGYSFQDFVKELQAHFQFGYAVTRIGGQVALHPNSRLSKFSRMFCHVVSFVRTLAGAHTPA